MGRKPGYKHIEETKDKFRVRRHSNETKQKMRDKRNEYWADEERSKEHRERLREIGRKPKSRETIQSIRETFQERYPEGFHHSEETKQRLREITAKLLRDENFRQKHLKSLSRDSDNPAWNGGKPECTDCGVEISYRATYCKSCARKDERHPNWKGGVSFELYPQEFNRELKLKIRERDNYGCQLCGMAEEESKRKWGQVLCVNHIDYNKQNCGETNLITLCRSCNSKANFNREYWQKVFPQ